MMSVTWLLYPSGESGGDSSHVVIKGGHLEGVAADILYDGREFTGFRGERIDTRNTHGTGCIFASAIAANLAHKRTVHQSVAAAKDFITAAIQRSLAWGEVTGPPIRWPGCIAKQDSTTEMRFANDGGFD